VAKKPNDKWQKCIIIKVITNKNHLNMTKQIILIFAVLCSVQVQANSRYTERDTVQHEFFHDATELFQPLQPVYLDGVVVPRTGSGNWFVSVTGGATAFLGTPLGCEDLFATI
jgi:hypothetical protein